MSRLVTRRFRLAVLALALGLAALSPAAALPQHTHLSTAAPAPPWIAVAWEALRDFLTGTPIRSEAASEETSPSSPPSSGGTVVPLVGSCIDPMGRPIPCNP